MSHFTTFEDDHDFDSVAVGEEFFNFAEFDVKVIVADFEANLHLF